MLEEEKHVTIWTQIMEIADVKHDSYRMFKAVKVINSTKERNHS